MSTSILCHTQGIRDFHHKSVEFSKDMMIWHITHNPEKFKCSDCLSSNVRIFLYGHRDIRGLPMGPKTLILRVEIATFGHLHKKIYILEEINFEASKCRFCEELLNINPPLTWKNNCPSDVIMTICPRCKQSISYGTSICPRCNFTLNTQQAFITDSNGTALVAFLLSLGSLFF